MRSAIAIAALLSIVRLSTPQSIDPNSVPQSQRNYWCQSQTTQCPLICLQTLGNTAATLANDCDPDTLAYDCVCSNGLSPNATEYSQTIPYFICTESGNQCVAACQGASACQSACRTDHPCGAQSPIRVNVTSSSTAAAATGTSDPTGTNAAGSAATTGADYSSFSSGDNSGDNNNDGGNNTGAASMLSLGQSYGFAVVVTGLFAGFGLLL